MTLQEIRSKIDSTEYDFLRTNEHLGQNVILLCLGGSYAYGMNIDTSDIDLRGCALNTKRELLTNINFEQFENHETDTVIYSFKKLVSLLSACNPNVIEMLGCNVDHYLYISPEGQQLLDNKHLFLSKKCVHTFGGYAIAQLRRLENISNRYLSQTEREQHILDTINHAQYDKHFAYSGDNIKLYIDKAVNPEMDSEIFIDCNFSHYPLRDYTSLWNELKSIVTSYNKVGKRNQHALCHNKIAKHMAHLVRLYLTCIELLETGEIHTYRDKEHDLLMNIRNGEYLDKYEQPIEEFYSMVDKFEQKLQKTADSSKLPDKPDYDKINDFIESIHSRVVGIKI